MGPGGGGGGLKAESRTRAGETVHDGLITHPEGCPKAAEDCWPLSRVASEGFESFMCCGETHPEGRSVPGDIFRLCIGGTHKTGVDLVVNMDERDVIDTASVLLAGLSSNANLVAVEEVKP